MDSQSRLWQQVYAAYEARDLDEARRLLANRKEDYACHDILLCGDENYVRWLLSNELIQPPGNTEETWPELQELQLQCNSLLEQKRPACILSGKIPTEDKE